jgi:hypothetical protein
MPSNRLHLDCDFVSETTASTYVANNKRVVSLSYCTSGDCDSVRVIGRRRIYKLRDWLNEHFPPEKD